MLMKYTADFKIEYKVGDMFQSINGDVWQVIFFHATYLHKELHRYTVERIWTYSTKRTHPNAPSTKGVWAPKKRKA